MDFPAATHDMQAAHLAEFGEDAVYLPAGKPAISPLRIIYDEPHKVVDLTTGAVVSTQEVSCDVRLSDLSPYVPRTEIDFVVVRGRKWCVNDVRPDGEGMATLVLTSPQPYG